MYQDSYFQSLFSIPLETRRFIPILSLRILRAQPQTVPCVVQAFSRWRETSSMGFDRGPVQVIFLADKVAQGLVFSPKYFGFTLSVSFHKLAYFIRLPSMLYDVGD
jgi:hypothetical protein